MKVYETLTDVELTVLLREGDERAFAVIYQRYKRPIFSKLLRLVKQEDIAKELLQDVFLKLWEKRATLESEKATGAFLYRIAQNLTIDLFRRATSDRKLLEHISVVATELYDPASEYDQNAETKFILQQALDILPPQRKKVYMLCKLEGKTYEEASASLGVSVSTVRDHMTKASKALQKHFSSREVALLMLAALFLKP